MLQKNKTVKFINADSGSKRLKITFKNGSLGQLTFKQIESFYNIFYLPDMQMELFKLVGECIPPKMQVKQINMIGSNFGIGAVNPNQNLNSNIIYNNSNSFLNNNK